ncbi:hypothetical protein [Maricaulis sp.]|uniref:hypothetical protein n=1 Tax=Maricaulis sp. TaxID=1486257 RepID=UPI0025C520D2|nr:hypothetical protein [Maricaulis sp.]
MTRRNRALSSQPAQSQTPANLPATLSATLSGARDFNPDYDAVLAVYENEALRMMHRCLKAQFDRGDMAGAVRTATTILKSLPEARRGNILLDQLEAIGVGLPPEAMSPEQVDAFLLSPLLGGPGGLR